MKALKQFARLPNIAIGLHSRRTFAAVAEQKHVKSESGNKELKLTLASPLKAVYANAVVRQIDVPGQVTSMGILPVHVPTIAMLKPGVLTVYEEDGGTQKFFVSSGTLSMNIDGTCQILAEEIATIDELDGQAAKQLLDESSRKAGDAAATEVDRAEAQIQMEVAEAVMKAAGQ